MEKESELTFPKTADISRLQDYDNYDKIYYGDHYEAFSIIGEKDFTKAYNKLRYIVANFGGLMSRVLADMLFGEKITIDLNDTNTQNFVDGLIEENRLFTQLYESALNNSRRGDSVFKLRVGQRNTEDLISESTVIIEEINPSIYFPEFNEKNARFTPSAHVLVYPFKVGVIDYLHKEKHTPGYITHEIYRYDVTARQILNTEDPIEFGFEPIEETKVKKDLIIHIPNFRDGNFFGTSDYRDLLTLFYALNNRLTKTDNILDKHSDPILAVPPGVLDENGSIRKEALNMFEVDNENTGFNKPEYVVWNANLESAEKEIEKLIDLLFMVSEIAPATMGADKNGQAESGRALKFKLLSTIRKRNRKKVYYDIAIKEMLETAQELAMAWGIKINGLSISKAERPTIVWTDGVINDETEMVDNAIKRIDAGILTKADAISALDGKTPDEAKKKVKEIDAENAIDNPITKTGGQFMNDKPIPKPTNQKV